MASHRNVVPKRKPRDLPTPSVLRSELAGLQVEAELLGLQTAPDNKSGAAPTTFIGTRPFLNRDVTHRPARASQPEPGIHFQAPTSQPGPSATGGGRVPPCDSTFSSWSCDLLRWFFQIQQPPEWSMPTTHSTCPVPKLPSG